MIDLQHTLDSLGFVKGELFSLSQKRDGKLVSATFETVARAEEWIDPETDCYLTGNPVREGTTGKAENADVAALRILLVDCDPKKDDDDPTGTSQERMDAAWNVASAVWEHFEEKGCLVASGRGAQVWLRVEMGVDRRALLAWIRDEFRDPLVDVDATHDASRLMRLPNTVNTRTGEIVALIDEGLPSPVSRSDVSDLLAQWSPPTQFEIPEADRADPTPREIRRYVTGDALKSWREDPMEITRDRSRRDFLFLCSVLDRGAPIGVASRLLHALPGSKAAERGDDSYWQSTAKAAMQSRADDKVMKDVLANVVARVEADPDYLTLPETIKVLARCYAGDPLEWLRLRGALKPHCRAQGLPVAEFEKQIKLEAKKLSDVVAEPPDHILIACQANAGGKLQWKMRTAKGWAWVSLFEAKASLVNEGDPDRALQLAMSNPFEVALEPFKPRLLPNRVWNESNARFAVEPSEGPHPTWDQLYRVVGRGLDSDLEGNAWARENGIATGADYLLAWTASMLQDPLSRRAYLALFSEEQGTGKSSFFEAHKLLIGSAVVKANKALTNGQFNGELAGAVLCYTEEVDLGEGGRKVLYNRMKDLTLGDTVSLEAKGGQPYEVPNHMSWGQASNSQSYCPVFDGDDRVTLFRVEPPRGDEKMPKEEFMRRLREEAPAFLKTLLETPLPSSKGRYVVPPIMTAVKMLQAKANRSDLRHWLGLRPDWVFLTEDEVVSAFRAWLDLQGLTTRFWSPQRVLRELPFEEVCAGKLWQRLGHEEFKGTASEIKEALGLPMSARKIGQRMALLEKADPTLVQRGSRGGSTTWAISPALGGRVARQADLA